MFFTFSVIIAGIIVWKGLHHHMHSL
eukprot:COSAG06_NODE_53594_length_299_cov_0.775000_1_plen_25_part_01